MAVTLFITVNWPFPEGDPLGGYFRNFLVGMCCWDPGILNLYQSFRAEKRSAQASVHPLSQAQGGLFCALTVFICCWSSE